VNHDGGITVSDKLNCRTAFKFDFSNLIERICEGLREINNLFNISYRYNLNEFSGYAQPYILFSKDVENSKFSIDEKQLKAKARLIKKSMLIDIEKSS